MRLKWSLGFAVFCAFLLASCAGNPSGPAAWIDQPLDGSQLKLEPVAVTAHASDSDGVSSFEFYLDDELVQTLSAGGDRLGEASWQWSPSQPGEFTIRVIPIDNQGNRGEAAQVQVFIADLSQVPVQETLSAAIEKIECLAGSTVAVTFNISSALGIESYGIWNVFLDIEHNETFQDPLPTTISKTVQITEPIQDEIDRSHQWGLEVKVPGQTAPTYTYAMEPNDRCPDHFKVVLADEQPPIVDLGLVEAKKNTSCRQGPDGLFEVSGYLLQGESADALGRLTDGSWIQVQLPETNYICWIAANQLNFDPDLLDTLPAVEPPPLPDPIITDTPEPDISAPAISGLSTNPALILTQSGGCPTYSRTTTVQAAVTDDVGVDLVTANWNVGGQSGQITLFRADGNIYQGDIGPVNNTGTLNITVTAWDEAGNSSSAGAPDVTVINCIG
ncbi:MAG: Ig-like domain-containing protein [Anaerolineales bacterium]